jgi:hypothetical protein
MKVQKEIVTTFNDKQHECLCFLLATHLQPFTNFKNTMKK